MLYWKDDIDLEYCKFGGDARYKPFRGRDVHRKKSLYAILRYLLLTPRLSRLNFLMATAEHMTWYVTQTEEGWMCPSDPEAWKHFDWIYLNFTKEPCNVRLGFCTEGFGPHGQYDCTYSCWPIIITPYNLPPSTCMSSEYIFLMMVIPSPSIPKRLIDVYLELLIEELLQLSYVGVRTCDHATDKAFMMRAEFIWIMNNLPTYGMARGWSTAGVMGCPVCMDDTRALHLQHGRKTWYFNYTDDSYLSIIPIERTRKPSRRIISRISIFW
ncbi:UNVERIFIED_CONTAM: hypothetical protein Sradi_5100400 [Sesamum radiatum]|uniref:Uncharacterized protein n=1 Tax=Sesamum radiatum TaxID=300843 RepID=A0AAW2M4A2_SESRA